MFYNNVNKYFIQRFTTPKTYNFIILSLKRVHISEIPQINFLNSVTLYVIDKRAIMKPVLFLCFITAIFCFCSCGGDSASLARAEDNVALESSSSYGASSEVELSSSSIPLSATLPSSETTELSSSALESSADGNSSFDATSSSSSIETISSSSSTPAISSSSLINNYDPETGILTDERDGQTYRTAKIGDQIWMAENFRFFANDTSERKCNLIDGSLLDKNDSLVAEYGRHYSWSDAMQLPCEYDYALTFTEEDSLFHLPHQGICPSGWHVPTISEWRILTQTPIQQLVPFKWSLSNIDEIDYYGMSLGVYNEDDENIAAYIATDEKISEKNDKYYTIIFHNDSFMPTELYARDKGAPNSYLRCLKD